MVVPPTVPVVAMAMMPVRGCGFVERKFLADADIQFAHSVSIESGKYRDGHYRPLEKISS